MPARTWMRGSSLKHRKNGLRRTGMRRKGMKRDSLDALWSLCIRTRDRWTCRRCQKAYTPPTQGLHAAHLFGRGMHSVRHDLNNGVALCYGCHRYLDTHPEEKTRWIVTWMPQEAYNLLLFRAHQPAQIDPGAIKLRLTYFLHSVTP